MRTSPWRLVRLALALTAVIFLGSCGSGTPEYRDGVRPVPTDQDHPWLKELQPVLLAPPEGMTPDQLMQTWKAFLGETSAPLKAGNLYTFVYYDFSHTLSKVFLDATFAPGHLLVLHRWKETGLFWGTWEIPRPLREKYRYTTGERVLVDPFHEDVEDSWRLLVDPDPNQANLRQVVGDSEAGLHGQDVQVLLPPGYTTDLSQTYSWILLLGDDDPRWARPWRPLLESHQIRPVVVVSLPMKDLTTPQWKALIEQTVIPWARQTLRLSPPPTDLSIVDWNRSLGAQTWGGSPLWRPSSDDPTQKMKDVTSWLTPPPQTP